jgi:hypothetical protein
VASRTCKRHQSEVAIRDQGRELEVAEVWGETSAVLYPHRFAAQVIKAFATRHKPLDRQTFQRLDRQQVKNCDSRADEISSFQPLLLGSHDDHYARAGHLCLGICLLRDAPPKILQMPLATRANLRKLQHGKSRVLISGEFCFVCPFFFGLQFASDADGKPLSCRVLFIQRLDATWIVNALL